MYTQGLTKRCQLSWLTSSALVQEPKCGGRGGVAKSQPMSTVHGSLNKLSRSNSIFNLRVQELLPFADLMHWLKQMEPKSYHQLQKTYTSSLGKYFFSLISDLILVRRIILSSVVDPDPRAGSELFGPFGYGSRKNVPDTNPDMTFLARKS